MLTIEDLRNYGADVDTGIKRCANKDSLYIRLVKTIPTHVGFKELVDAIAIKDFEAAFQAAHGLKGVTSNLSLDPLMKPIIEITEHLRNKEDIDYQPLLDEIELQRSKLEEICKDD